MERRVKERMVGAAILVAIVVLVVPALLSGPAPRGSGGKSAVLPAVAPEPMRTVRVDVNGNGNGNGNGNAETAAAVVAGYAHASSAAGAPQLAAKVPTAAATPAPATVPITAPAATPVATPAPAAAPSNVQVGERTAPVPHAERGAWTVQLGSFESQPNAQKLMKHWKEKGYSAYVSSVGAGASRRHRVRIGPYADRATALKAVARLKAARQAASIVAPGH